jgi:hypothetical protein
LGSALWRSEFHHGGHEVTESTDIDFTALATLNRPLDAQAMRAAIHELRHRGMSDYGIAAATQLDVAYVRRVLGERKEQHDQ